MSISRKEELVTAITARSHYRDTVIFNIRGLKTIQLHLQDQKNELIDKILHNTNEITRQEDLLHDYEEEIKALSEELEQLNDN